MILVSFIFLQFSSKLHNIKRPYYIYLASNSNKKGNCLAQAPRAFVYNSYYAHPYFVPYQSSGASTDHNLNKKSQPKS